MTEEARITGDPVVAAQLAGLLRRGLARHHARQRAGEPEPPEVTREREEIAAMLAARRRARKAGDAGPAEPARPGFRGVQPVTLAGLAALPVGACLELSASDGGDSCLNCGGPPPACWSSEDCTWLDP